MKKSYYILMFMLFMLINGTKAQNVYRTFSGEIAISIDNEIKPLILVSRNLSVLLDYETSKISFSVPLKTFKTNNDSINRLLAQLKDVNIEFNGKLGISINSKNFAPQNANIEGTITTAHPPAHVFGKGTMYCMPAGDRATPACSLLLSIESKLSDLNLSTIFPEAKDAVRIDLHQSILEKEKP